MKFLVRKTSDRYNTERPPVKGAVFEWFDKVDIRTARPKDIPAFKDQPEDWWYGDGVNHRELTGPRGGFRGIARDFPDGASGWFIEIDSLENLIEFHDKHGSIIIDWCSDNDSIREIEIYDDYKE